MAAGGEEKTEEPTDHKKREARKKGNIPKSRDLSSAMLLLVAITLLRYIGPWMAYHMRIFFIKMLEEQFGVLEIPEGKELIPYALTWFMWLAMLAAPFLFLMFIAAYLANYYQVGFLITTEPLKFDLNKLNPVAGFKRIFSTRQLVMLAMNLAKLAVVMGVAWATILGEVQNVLAMVEMETAGMFIYTIDHVFALAQKLAILLMILGYADFKYQKYKNNKDLKMTKQEIKEEFKQMDGDPKVKQKRRQKQMELAQNRMMQEVPQAEVVVRNPTHFAVAIKYKPEMAAPEVVAKGKDNLAMQIIDIARAHNIPTVENPPLARELYKKVEVGQTIPAELYEVVAEILAMVFREDMKKKYIQESRERTPEPAY